MEALWIISSSWQIVMMFMSVSAGCTIYLIVRRVTDTTGAAELLRLSQERIEMQSELHRLKAIEHKGRQ